MSLGLGVSAVAMAAVIGSLLGLVAGYAGRRVDLVLRFCMDILLAFPSTSLAIAIVAMIGPGLRNSLLAISRWRSRSTPGSPGGRCWSCGSWST